MAVNAAGRLAEGRSSAARLEALDPTPTILDEDDPGKLAFEETDIQVVKAQGVAQVKIRRDEGTDGRISCLLKTAAFFETQQADDADGMIKNAREYEDYQPVSQIVTFENGESEKLVEIKLIEDNITGNVEKIQDKAGGDEGGESDESDAHIDLKFKVLLEKPEPEKVKLSRKSTCYITIKPDELQGNVEEANKLLEYFLKSDEPSWADQFVNATVLGPKIDGEKITEDVTCMDAVMHFCAITWKVLFAIVPPSRIWGGYAAFSVAIAFIGLVTLIVGDTASVLGCVLGWPDSVTAITLVALGTSLPDTFASVTAAKTSSSADAAIGNVTGSNSVNIFLGLGLPWVLASHYCANAGIKYVTPAGNLGFSVVIFLIVSITCFLVLVVRRHVIGGELGGPPCSRYASAAFLVTLWVIYVVLSILRSGNIITTEIGLPFDPLTHGNN